MLHEVAGSDVAVTDIVQPLRKMLRHTRVVIANIEAIDLVKKQVRITRADLPDPVDVSYDQLVLALGAVTNFFNTPGLAEHAVTLKTLGDAILVRNRVIDALELADNQTDETRRQTTLTAVMAGGGFAGIETAGAVNDFLRAGMKFYHRLKEDTVRVVVVDPGDHILPELGMSLGHYAQKKAPRARGGHPAEDEGRRLRRPRGDARQRHEDRHAHVDLDRGHHAGARAGESALRVAAGPHRGERMYASAELSRRLGVWRLRARAGRAETGQILSADRAARHPAGGDGREEHRRDDARPAAAAVQVQDARHVGGHWTAHRGGENARHEVLRNYRLVALALHLPEQTSGFREESSRRARLDP